MYFVLFVTHLYLSLLSPFSVSLTLHFFLPLSLNFYPAFYISSIFWGHLYFHSLFAPVFFALFFHIFIFLFYSSVILLFFLFLHPSFFSCLPFVSSFLSFFCKSVISLLLFTPSFLPFFLPITLSLFFLFPYLCSFVNLTLLLTLNKSLFFLFHLSINWRSTGICLELYVYMFFFCSKVWDKNNFMQHSLTPTPPYAFSLRCELGTRHNSKYSKKNSSTKFILGHDLHRLKIVVCT